MNREIDVYPEYSGTALAMILKAPRDTDVRAEYSRRFHLAWLDPLGIDNGFAMVVRGADARSRGLKNIVRCGERTVGFGSRLRVRSSCRRARRVEIDVWIPVEGLAQNDGFGPVIQGNRANPSRYDCR